MNTEKFLAGSSFTAGHASAVYKCVKSTWKTGEDNESYMLWEKAGNDWIYHCNVDKITKNGISVYNTLAGKTIRRFVRFSEMKEKIG